MKTLLNRIPLLLEHMRETGKYVSIGSFNYQRIGYTVIYKGDSEKLKNNKYYSMMVEFYDNRDFQNNLKLRANSHGFDCKTTRIMMFFIRHHVENNGFKKDDFLELLNEFIPTEITFPRNNEQKSAICYSTIDTIGDENRLYCSHLMLNGQGHHRTINNTLKTQALRPDLFDAIVKNTKNNANFISFCYSNDPDLERTDSEIINDAHTIDIL